MAARKHGIIAARRHSGKRGIFERKVLTPALLRIAGESPDTKHACNLWFTRLHTQGYSAPHDAPSRTKSGIFASIFSCLVNLSRHSETRKWNAESETRKVKHEEWNTKSKARTVKHEEWNADSETQKMQHGKVKRESETRKVKRGDKKARGKMPRAFLPC